MQQKRGFRRFATATALVLCAMLGSCSRSDPEQAVRDRIASVQEAVDARDAGQIEAFLADDFIGNDGMDRRAIRQLAAGVFLRHRDVSARIGPVDVELRGEDEAVARFTVAAAGGSGGLLPEQGQLYQVETGWRRVDGEWMLLNASWKPNL